MFQFPPPHFFVEQPSPSTSNHCHRRSRVRGITSRREDDGDNDDDNNNNNNNSNNRAGRWSLGPSRAMLRVWERVTYTLWPRTFAAGNNDSVGCPEWKMTVDRSGSSVVNQNVTGSLPPPPPHQTFRVVHIYTMHDSTSTPRSYFQPVTSFRVYTYIYMHTPCLSRVL